MNKKPWNISRPVIKIPIPNTFQYLDYTCGGIALKSILEYYNKGRFTEDDMIKELNMPEDGTDPWMLINVIQKFKLNYREYHSMTRKQLIYCIDLGRPVMIMVQAWSEKKIISYKDVWDEGHWIVAIGYDNKGFYFEDPSHKDFRGFIPYAEFEDRWHDTGNLDLPEDHYGLVIWSDKIKLTGNTKKAAYIP